VLSLQSLTPTQECQLEAHTCTHRALEDILDLNYCNYLMNHFMLAQKIKKNTQVGINIWDDPPKFNTYQWAFIYCKCHWIYAKSTSK
jgi:hypothetical protein